MACYRPQRSCEGYVFTPVCHSVHRGGVCLSACWDTTPREQTHPPSRHPPGADTHPSRADTTPGSRHPPEQTPPGRRLPLRTVRILLECILVRKLMGYLPRNRAKIKSKFRFHVHFCLMQMDLLWSNLGND